MQIKTNTKDFERFHNQLIRNYPQYKPHYLLLKKNDKAPMGAFGSAEHRLDFEDASAKMAEGYNIGIAGTPYDGLVTIDVDDRKAFEGHKFESTLQCKSSSRLDHYFYFTFDSRCKVNVALADIGELRTNWQYVVAPGSFVDIADAVDKEGNVTKTIAEYMLDIPENDRENAGKYTVENESGLSSIVFENIPEQFRNAGDERAEKDKEIIQKRAERIAAPKQEVNNNKSAIYDLKIQDVINVSTDQNFSSVFHGSKTGNNTIIKDDLLHCFRCQVSHTALTALACLAGMYNCVDAGTGHKGSGSGMSHVDTNDGETIFKLWEYAKSNGYIPENDKIPAKALVYYAISNGICDESDVIDGWKLTPKAYAAALNLLNGVIEPEMLISEFPEFCNDKNTHEKINEIVETKNIKQSFIIVDSVRFDALKLIYPKVEIKQSSKQNKSIYETTDFDFVTQGLLNGIIKSINNKSSMSITTVKELSLLIEKTEIKSGKNPLYYIFINGCQITFTPKDFLNIASWRENLLGSCKIVMGLRDKNVRSEFDDLIVALLSNAKTVWNDSESEEEMLGSLVYEELRNLIKVNDFVAFKRNEMSYIIEDDYKIIKSATLYQIIKNKNIGITLRQLREVLRPLLFKNSEQLRIDGSKISVWYFKNDD